MTSPQPLVSIGVPIYNGARTLIACLESLIAQDYQNMEIVICDNASTDETERMCRLLATRDRRIRYFRNASNIGLTRNFRRVLNLSLGEFFTWASVDDLRPPRAIQSLAECLIHNSDAVMAHGPVLVNPGNGGELVIFSNTVRLNHDTTAERVRAFTRHISHNSMVYGLYRRAALERAVFGDHYAQDYLLALQMCFLGKLEYVGTPMIIYRERRLVPCRNRMYRFRPITLGALLKENGQRRRKCWTVLILGSYYGLAAPGVAFNERVSGVGSHIRWFTSSNSARLSTEVLFQLFEPLSRVCIGIWKIVKRRSHGLWLARSVRAVAPSLAPRWGQTGSTKGNTSHYL